jgi:outer membrane biosynthesis protein TonB
MPLFETPTKPRTPPSATELQPSGEQPTVVVAGRHGEWDTHELIRLLDTIEDERARGRFRESLYISIFVWIAITWFIFYGPRVLWHQPQLRDPASVLRDRELTQLTLPSTHLPSTLKATPPKPRPSLDKDTMDRLRSMSRPAPTPAPAPTAAAPKAPEAAAPPPPPPPVAQPRLPQPVPDAPTAQPTRPDFGSPTSAGNSIQQALNAAARNRDAGGDSGGPSRRQGGPLNLGGAEVLSDTQGVDFGPYIRRILSDIKRNWDPLIPAEAQSPLYKQGESFIRFTINPDGSIAAMHLDDSTHDEAIDRSCWGSITSEGQFPPLPKQFRGPNLELRIHYLVNKQLSE